MPIHFNPTENEVLQEIVAKSLDLIDQETTSEKLHPLIQVKDNVSELVFRPLIDKVGDTEIIDYIEPDNSAISQFLTRIGVPVVFFKRCTAGLQQAIVNEHNRNKSFLLRCRAQEGKSTICRAVVSTEFSREMDDKHVYPPVIESLKSDTTQIKRFEWDDHLSLLKAEYQDCAVTVGDVTAVANITVTNSETGHSSVWYIPGITINDYEYGNKYGEKSQHLNRMIHRGKMFDPEDIKIVIKETKDIAQVGIMQYLKAQQETVTIEHAIEFTKNIDDFPRRFSKILEEDWKRQEVIAKTRVMQDIVNAARELPLVQRLTVSNQVGRFIRLFENCNEAKNELSNILNK